MISNYGSREAFLSSITPYQSRLIAGDFDGEADRVLALSEHAALFAFASEEFEHVWGSTRTKLAGLKVDPKCPGVDVSIATANAFCTDHALICEMSHASVRIACSLKRACDAFLPWNIRAKARNIALFGRGSAAIFARQICDVASDFASLQFSKRPAPCRVPSRHRCTAAPGSGRCRRSGCRRGVAPCHGSPNRASTNTP